MAEETLVEKRFEDGEKLIGKLRAATFDVSAASWVQEEDGGLWYLYLASRLVDQIGQFDSYKKLNLLLRGMTDLSIDPFEIKLIGAAHPMAQEIVNLQKQFPARLHNRYRLHNLGGLRIGEAHIYPPITTP